MPKRGSKEDLAKVRSILLREVAAGASYEEAFRTAYAEDPDSYRRAAGMKARAKSR